VNRQARLCAITVGQQDARDSLAYAARIGMPISEVVPTIDPDMDPELAEAYTQGFESITKKE
jgi:hypothetical protein